MTIRLPTVSGLQRGWRRIMASPCDSGQASVQTALRGGWFAPPWCGKPHRAPSPSAACPAGFPKHLIARMHAHGMFVATRCWRQVPGRTASHRSPSRMRALPSITQKGVCYEEKTRVSIGCPGIRLAEHHRIRGRRVDRNIRRFVRRRHRTRGSNGAVDGHGHRRYIDQRWNHCSHPC